MKWYYWLAIAVLLILLLIKRKAMFDLLAKVLQHLEGFSSVPYWDFKQWSWGYGTRVPGSVDNKNVRPGGTITKERAAEEAVKYSKQSFNTLSKRITKKLNTNQWAAILSFDYNTGSASKLVSEINDNSPTLESHIKQYIYAGGKVNPGLVARRAYEWKLYNS